MKLFYLGLMAIAVILVLISISMNNVEGFDYEGRKDDQRKFLKDNDRYWDSRLFPQVIKGVDKESKFVELSKDKTKLNEISPTAKTVTREIGEKIEKCKLINLTGNCEEIDANECGYCWDTDKIVYGDKNGPIADVCSKKNWIPPGPKTGYYCQKKKEQEICKKMKDCGDSTGEKSICGWCPLTASGMPKKAGPNGGFVPKYDDDKCDWKGKLELGHEAVPDKTVTFLGWSPNKGGFPPRRGPVNSKGVMTPAPRPYGAPLDRGEGDCDNDEDCGPGMKCGHDGRGPDGKPGVPGLKYANGGKILPNSGYKDYCYDPKLTREPPFDGDLIQPADCKKFEQMFPCVGPNMLTGPHTDACLQSLWKKSGCTGTLTKRVTDQNDYKNWNSHSYGTAKNNMTESIRKVAQTGTDYTKAELAYKKCYGTDVDPCENRFKPRPPSCAQKIYDSTGCLPEGELNPKNTLSWPNAYVGNTWKKGQEGDWSVNTLKSQILSYKRQMITNLRNPKKDFDRTIYTSKLCNGTMPNIPWDKPCWRDFNIIMNTIPGVYTDSNTGNLSFKGANNSFKSLLQVKTTGWWNNDHAWSPNYEITKATYDKKYFPFWNFVKMGKDYWNKNWDLFKSKMLKVPSVKAGGMPTNSKWHNWSNSWWLKRPKGHGDCDSDRDCGPGLKCWQNPRSIPGVVDTGAIRPNRWGAGRDFCYDPNDVAMGGGGDTLSFMGGSPFDSIIQTSNSTSVANSKGYFFASGGRKFLTKQAFLHEDFPYWLFLRVAKVN